MPETEFHSQSKIEAATRPQNHQAEAACPFRNGSLTIDLLLAEIGTRDSELLDAVLDLRMSLKAQDDAWGLLEQLYRVRRMLNGRAYLAFYKVRCWAKRELLAEVRPSRTCPWQRVELPLNAGNLNEAVNTCLANLPDEACVGGERWNGLVRFRFAAASAELQHVA